MTEPPRETLKARLVRAKIGDKVRATLGKIPFSEEALAAYYCARDTNTPTRVRATIIGALAYFITPVDAIPDFLALLGYSDDAAVFWAVWRTVQAHVTDAHRQMARQFLGGAPLEPEADLNAANGLPILRGDETDKTDKTP